MRRAPTLPVTAESVVAAVRVHADRVHDAVRRQGAGPAASVQVVETSALDLVDSAADNPAPVGELVGEWFARARGLAARAERDLGELPVGGGLLSADDEQARLAEALELRPERERTALLLRDAYDLPATTVAAALGVGPDEAMALVGRARLALLPDVYDTEVPVLAGHAVDQAALARISEGRQVLARDATTRRHAQGCGICRPAVDAQDDARRLLQGLSVVALPAADRELLVQRVQARAEAMLQPASVVAELAAENEVLPRRLFSPLPVLLALAATLALGAGVGAVLGRSRPVPVAAFTPLPVVTQSPLPTVPPAPDLTVPTPSPGSSPTTRVFDVPADPPPYTPPPYTPPPLVDPTTTTTSPTGRAQLTVDPPAGPNGQLVSVSGTGFTPNAAVTIDYLAPDGTQGSTGTIDADGTGAFSTSFRLSDPDAKPGGHTVLASDGDRTARANYDATVG